jgi:hypothetical protein
VKFWLFFFTSQKSAIRLIFVVSDIAGDTGSVENFTAIFFTSREFINNNTNPSVLAQAHS